MTDMLTAQTLVSTASSLLQDPRLARVARLDTVSAAIEEYRGRLSKTSAKTWLSAALLGLSLLALSGPA